MHTSARIYSPRHRCASHLVRPPRWALSRSGQAGGQTNGQTCLDSDKAVQYQTHTYWHTPRSTHKWTRIWVPSTHRRGMSPARQCVRQYEVVGSCGGTSLATLLSLLQQLTVMKVNRMVLILFHFIYNNNKQWAKNKITSISLCRFVCPRLLPVNPRACVCMFACVLFAAVVGRRPSDVGRLSLSSSIYLLFQYYYS